VSSRDEAVRLLEQQHSDVASLLAELDEAAFTQRGTIGGGEWSAKDLAAHLGSWEEIAVTTMAEFRRGERPSIEEEFTREGATDRLNEQEVRRFLDARAPDVMARFEDLHRQIVDAIEGMTDEEWAGAYAFDPEDRTLGERVGSLLGSEAGGFTHASAHLDDLRAYVDSIRR
jgi:hypothetical protein